MRHFRKVGADRLAANIFTERHWKRELARGEGRAFQKGTEINGLAILVRQLNTNGILTRNDGDTRRGRAHGSGNIVGERDDT